MAYSISVENIKCGGCANTITTKLKEQDFIDDCKVDIENGVVTIEGDAAKKSEAAQLPESCQSQSQVLCKLCCWQNQFLNFTKR